MKNFKLKRLLGLAFIGGFSALSASTVFAAAGEDIDNIATLSFDVGGVSTDIESSPTGNTTIGTGGGAVTSFKEDNLINFSVATTDIASVGVSPSETLAYLSFTVTNNGNGAQDFSLSALEAATNDDVDPFTANLDAFDVASYIIRVEDGTNAGTYEAAEDTGTYIDELAPGGVATVYIVSTIPGLPLADDALAVMTLVAQVAAGDAAGATGAQGADITTDDSGNTDTASEQNVFNDPSSSPGLVSAGTADVVKNGLHSDASSYKVGAAILTVTKTATAIWDDINTNTNPKMIPGHSSYVQYTITIANDANAGASGDLTTLADTLQSNLALDPHFLNGAATQAATSANGDSFEIDTTGTSRASAGTTYCTASNADTDGCVGTTAANSVIGITFSDGAGTNSVGTMKVEGTHAEGELKKGESIVIKFNAIIP